MSRSKHQGLETEQAGPEGPGDVRAAMTEVREQLEGSLRLQFAQAERTIAARMQERLAGADALIARLTAENAALAETNARLQEEKAKAERTLARLRELALAAP